MQRTRTAKKGDQDLQTNVPPEKQTCAKVLRRSARIAASNMKKSEGKNKDNITSNKEQSKIKLYPKVKRNNGSRSKLNPMENKKNDPDQVEENLSVIAERLPLESLSLTSRTHSSTSANVGCTDLPVNIVKSRKGIKTLGSRAKTFNKRNNSSVVYFTQMVEREETKFKLSCDKWNTILEERNVPEAVQGHILSAIGQANLFQNKRFKQFKQLIELHKDTTAEQKATESDLAGFWEMIYYQVEDVHKRFCQLDVLKSNNWEEEKVEPEEEKKVQLKVRTKKAVDKKVKKPTVQSNFMLFRQQMLAKTEVQKQYTRKQNDILIY